MQLQHPNPLSLVTVAEETGRWFQKQSAHIRYSWKSSFWQMYPGKGAPLLVCFVRRHWELLWHPVSERGVALGFTPQYDHQIGSWGLGRMDEDLPPQWFKSISKRPTGLWGCGSFLRNATHWQDGLCFLPSAAWTGLRLTEFPHHPCLRRWKWLWAIPAAWGTSDRFD